MNLLAISDAAAPVPAQPRASSADPASTGAARSASSAPAAIFPNPILVLDATSGVMVLEYRNVVTGTVESDDLPRAALRYRQTQHLSAS